MTKIQVTRTMVDYALQQTSTLCAVALALRDANDDWVLPLVTQDEIRYTDRRTQERVILSTPPKVAEWIDRFDKKRELVKPFSFELDTTNAVRRPIVRKQPSEMIRQAVLRKDKDKVIRRQRKIPVGSRPKNTSKRELRPAEVTGLAD